MQPPSGVSDPPGSQLCASRLALDGLICRRLDLLDFFAERGRKDATRPGEMWLDSGDAQNTRTRASAFIRVRKLILRAGLYPIDHVVDQGGWLGGAHTIWSTADQAWVTH